MKMHNVRNCLLAASLAFAGNAAAIPAQTPLFLVKSARPMVMLTMSVDHQLFMKAFADYSDLNGDGVIDNTYTDSFDYYGYFDNKRCYEYNSTDSYFQPTTMATGTNAHHCSGATDWSGNFLNWATMTRIDVLRKALYGGKRSVDDTSQTILERALLPSDVHAFVKVFETADAAEMQNYTPYAVTSISLCNSTPATSGQTQSIDTASAGGHPKMRIAEGDWGRWAADEAYQCEWEESRVEGGKNGNGAPKSANLFSANSSAAPSVRVDACVTGRLEQNCRIYNDATAAKPIGLLQEFGEDGTLRFGLMSGSYQKRDRGGVLRKGISELAGNAAAADDEVNLANGTFNTGVNGIISALDKLRINQWDYAAHDYLDCDEPGISVTEYLSDAAPNRKCSNWGNPVSELYLEAVRYLSGASSPTATFNVAADSLGLPTATWDNTTDPMPSEDWCAPMNVVLISSGDNEFDTDHLGNVPGALGAINSATDAIGVQEGFSGDVFIGEVGATPTASPDSNACSAKPFTSLSQMRGLCPGTPTKQGGYAVAGLAYKAHVTDLRTDRDNDPETGAGQTVSTFAVAMAKSLPDFVFDVDGRPVTIVPNGYASFAAATPPLDDASWKASSLAQVQVEETVYGAVGNLVYARFLAHWEDSAWGNDYDMDVISRISVCVAEACAKHDDDGDGALDLSPGSGTMRVTTRAIHASSGASMKVGFVVSGTTADGEYTTVIKPQGASYSSLAGDSLWAAPEPLPAVVTFVPGLSNASMLPTPLQLAAKYGGFRDANDNDQPEGTEWDEDGDGLAENYFFADDPSQLGPKLASFLDTVATTSSASAVVANSVSFQSTTRIYQARFDSRDWSGQLLSFPLDVATGAVLPAEWDAATLMRTQNFDSGREILTWDPDGPSGGAGVPFRWADINATQQGLLGNENRLNFLRGDTSLEQANGGAFRDRVSLLGDNVNSSPAVVGAPSYDYLDSMESAAYSAFIKKYDEIDCGLATREREPIVYFGANDGMLHGVSACTGHEEIAYVPNALMAELPKLTSPSYSHQYYVDGAPTIVDAFWTGSWHTVLVGSTRAGGQAVFALDVTDPSNFDEARASNVVLWERSSSDTGFGDLGYTFSQPAIVKAKGHGWVSIFGNGYNSAGGKAVLYIVDIDDGGLQDAILLDSGPGNGLSTVAPVDVDNDGLVDLIYAGDLKGNVWRIEAGNSGFAANTVSLLYVAKDSAGNRQPITTRLEVGLHPSSYTGRMVYFGTGKYYEPTDGDPTTSGQQSMYGIWDRDDGKSAVNPTVPPVTTRDYRYLQKQTVDTQTLSSFDGNSYDIRVLSDHAMAWIPPDSNKCGDSNPGRNATAGDGDEYLQCGWYLDLPDTGEKMVADPILRGGRLIFVTTIPSLSSCSAGGESWLMEIDAASGGRLDQPVFDLNGDGVFDFNDNYVNTVGGDTKYEPISGKKSKVGILQPPAIVAGVGGAGTGGYGKAEAKYSSGSRGGEIDVTIEHGGLPAQGRKSWIQFK